MMPRMKAAWYHRLDIVRGFGKDQECPVFSVFIISVNAWH